MARKKRKIIRPSPQAIRESFETADEDSGGERSTEFLAACVADQLGIKYSDVLDALAETAGVS